MQNSFYFWNKQNIDDIDLLSNTQNLAASFQTRMLVFFIAFQNTQLHYSAIKVTTLIPNPGPFAELQIENQTGAQGDFTLCTHDAAVITLLSSLSGRSRRGRLYIPGVDAENVEGNTLKPTYFSSLGDIAIGLLSHYGGGGADDDYRYTIYSKKLGRPLGLVDTFNGVFDVVQTVPRKLVATQRHRKQGHGP